MSNKNNQLDSLAVLLQELIENYADQIDFEKEVETIITQIVSNPTFAKKLKKKSIFK